MVTQSSVSRSVSRCNIDRFPYSPSVLDKTAKSQKHHNGIFKNLRKNKSTTSFSPSPSGFHEISLKETYSYKPSSLASSTSDLSVSSIPPPDTVRLVNSDVKAIPMARGSDSDRNYSGSTYQGSPEIVHDEYYKSPELGNDQQPEPEFHQRKEPQVSLFLTLALLAVVTVVRFLVRVVTCVDH